MERPEESELLKTDGKPISFSKDFPLHYLAKVGNSEELQYYLEINPQQAAKEINRVDFYWRTPLHYVALTDNLTGGEQCTKELLNFYQNLENSAEPDGNGTATGKFSRLSRRERRILQKKADVGEETRRFINMKDIDGQTALSLAAINENANIVQQLLAKSADVLTKSDSGEQALELIYANTPSAVISLLDQSVFFDYGNLSYDLTKIERSYLLDLSPIVGEPENLDNNDYGNRPVKEVELLHSVNKETVRARGEILKHPLVQIFLKKKSEEFKLITWCAILFHLIWVGFYNYIVMDTYYDCCELRFKRMNSSICATYASNNITQGTVNLCIERKDTIYRPVFVILISIIIGTKELYKLFFLKGIYMKMKNLIVWVFIIILFLTAKPNSPIVPFHIMFQLSSFGIIFSGLVIIELIHKHIYWAIYIKVLLKVFNRFLAILPIFIFVMVVFAASLRMHFPFVHSPVFSSFESFRDSVMLIFETITDGKVNWEGTYKDNINNNFYISGFFIYTGFYVIVTLLLFKILTGFVVADTKKLQEQEEINSISDDLEAVFIYESFLLSKAYDWLSSQKCFSFLYTFREKFLLCKLENGNRNLKIKIMESEIPVHELRKSIRMLASKNTAKLKMPEFLMEKPSVVKEKRRIFSFFRKNEVNRNTANLTVSPSNKK